MLLEPRDSPMQRSAPLERTFGLTVGGLLLLLGLLAAWRSHPYIATVLESLGAILVLGGLLIPSWLAPLRRRWMAMAALMGAFNARVILTVAYYLVVTPVGLMMRLAGRDPLDRRLRTGDSYWHRRAPEPPASRDRYARLS